MAWKRKEKDLTLPQVIEAVRSELAPFWIGSPPILAAVEWEGNISAHPVDERFQKHPWLMFYVDPHCFAGEGALAYARVWIQRYRPFGLDGMIVLPELSEAVDKTQIEHRYSEFNSDLPQAPIAIDQQCFVCRSFRIKSFPSMIFFSEGKQTAPIFGKHWTRGLEIRIQNFLRAQDRGLSLPLPHIPHEPDFADLVIKELGSAPTNFGIASTQLDASTDIQLGLDGVWSQEKSHIHSNDPTTRIRFQMVGERLGILARSLSKIVEKPKIVVEINDAPVFDVFAGSDLSYDDTGRSVIEVREPRFYNVLKGLTPKDVGKVTLSFPSAKTIPIAIHRLCLGAKVD